MSIGRRRLLSLALTLPSLIVVARAQDVPLETERTIALPAVSGRIDHLTLDATGSKLWVAALGNNTVEVLDLAGGKPLQSLSGPKEPQGICLIPDLKRIVVASGEDGMVRAYDDDRKVVASVSGLEDADNVRYDPSEKRLYVGYGKGALGVLDRDKLTKLKEIPLDGHPESFQLEQHGQRLFVNVPTAQHVAVVDRKTGSVIARWPVKEAQANYPMALDEGHQRLFVVCRKPARLHALRYAGRSPCRCFAPVLIQRKRRVTPNAIYEHLPKAHLRVS